MLQRGNVARDHAGDAALELLVPNVGSLSWEAIIEFRDHAGWKEARQRLPEVEDKAAVSDPPIQASSGNGCRRKSPPSSLTPWKI
jgi:hypothetical protein